MEIFARPLSKVENYLRFRPNYPRKLIDFLYDECGFSWESVIADIGSGTGIFTRLLLERGSRVVGIEPNMEMRQTAERILCDEFPRFVSLDAKAENTTLSDASINHIVCAQSFHFFDVERCRNEFSRILKSGGTIALIRSSPVFDGDDFSQEYDALIRRHEVNGMYGREKSGSDVYLQFFSKKHMSVFTIPGQHILDLEGLKARTLSIPDIPSHGERGYNELLEDLEILFELYSISGKVTLRYQTEAYSGKPGMDV